MTLFKNRIFRIVLLLSALLLAGNALAQDLSSNDEAPSTTEQSAPPTPELADIVPFSSALSGRLIAIKNQLHNEPEVSKIEKSLAEIEASLDSSAKHLPLLSGSMESRHYKLVKLKIALEKERDSLAESADILRQKVSTLGAWRKEWSEEKANWEKWQASFIEDEKIYELKSTFIKAHRTIDTALSLILPQLKLLLSVQENVVRIEEKDYTLSAELDSLMSAIKKDALIEASPPMYSLDYFSQFESSLWPATVDSLDNLSWSSEGLLDRLAWIVFLQIFLFFAVVISIYRRPKLRDSKRWSFLAARPFSAGFLISISTTMWLFEYEGAADNWDMANSIVCGLAVGRLIDALTEIPWKRQFVWFVLFAWIFAKVIYFLDIPLPLLRLFTAGISLISAFSLLYWARRSRDDENNPSVYTWSLRFGALFCFVIFFAEIVGKERLAGILFLSSLRSVVLVLAFILLMRLVHGLLEYLFHQLLPRQVKRIDVLIDRMSLFISFAALVSLIVPGLLMIWEVYATFYDAFQSVMGIGLNFGSQNISLRLILVAVGVLYGTILTSSLIQELLVDDVLIKRRMEVGVRISIARLVHYLLLFTSFLVVMWILGFQFTKLVIVLSALGVGIGFGLQSIVNNFISGLILLFERPVRVGDSLEFEGQWVVVKHIGLRATTVQTFDQADVMIPNANLVSNPVTNWTLSNRQVRLRIPVGVAYGSDIPLVMQTLLTCGTSHELVIKNPEPQVLFLGFGESSLDLELRTWVLNADQRLQVKSELLQEIDRRFREEKIVIPFPQQDLHLRTMDDAAVLHSPKSTGPN